MRSEGSESETVNETVPTKLIYLLKYFEDYPSAAGVTTIQRRTGKPRATLYRHLQKLHSLGYIEHNINTWELSHFKSTPLKMRHLLRQGDTELHDFSYVVRMVSAPDWWKSKRKKLVRLREVDVHPVDWGRNPYEQLAKDSFIVQFHRHSLIVISRKKYLGDGPYDCFIQAVSDFLDLINWLEALLQEKFFVHGLPNAMVRSQHYVDLKDAVAKYCVEKREKGRNVSFNVMTRDGRRMWIDFSQPVGMEAGDPEDLSFYQHFWKSLCEMDEPVDMQQMMNMIGANTKAIAHVTENQAVFAQGLASHTKVNDSIARSAKVQERATMELTKAVKMLSNTVGSGGQKQMRIGDYVSDRALRLVKDAAREDGP